MKREKVRIMEMVKQEKKTNILTNEITITAMFIALTLVFTYCVQIRLPIAANGGLIHLGNIPLFIAPQSQILWDGVFLT